MITAFEYRCPDCGRLIQGRDQKQLDWNKKEHKEADARKRKAKQLAMKPTPRSVP